VHLIDALLEVGLSRDFVPENVPIGWQFDGFSAQLDGMTVTGEVSQGDGHVPVS
jgi:hypothetical protein